MKKLTGFMIILTIVLTVFSSCIVPASAEAGIDKTSDDRNYYGFHGRLSIPDVDIDVALYDGVEQSVCDRWDSACIFPIAPYPGEIIADHCNQEFSTLTSVAVGTIGQITLADDTLLTIRCTEVFDGHNTGYSITDAGWNNVLGKYEYLMYTCINGWENVRVCQWEIIQD